MHWITAAWSFVASACFTLGLVSFSIWLRDRSSRPHLLFSTAAVAIAGIAAFELQMMRAQTPEEFGAALRWIHIPLFVVFLSLVWFIRVHFGTGRLWLAWGICALRLVVLILNFSVQPNFNYSRITAVHPLTIFAGETVSVAEGVFSPWIRVGQFSSIAFLVYVIDASVTLWRRGRAAEKRRAALMGGSLSFFVVIAVIHTLLIQQSVIQSPYLISMPFLGPLFVMGFGLSSDLVGAAQLARQLAASRSKLQESEEQFSLAANAAELGLWQWDADEQSLWMTEKGRAMHGIEGTERIRIDEYLAAIYRDDRERVRSSMTQSLGNGGHYAQEYRVTLPHDRMRWINARGQAHRTEIRPAAAARQLRGVCADVTDRRQAAERFRLVVEAAPHAMLVVEPEGRIVLVNEQAERVFGYERSELIGRPIDILVPERHRKDYAVYRAGYIAEPSKRAMGKGPEIFGRRKDGSEVPLEIGLSPIREPEATFVLASVVDISSRRQAEREAARQRNELAHLSRVTMLGELSGSLAHELNQPLTAILSNAQAAQRFLASGPGDAQEIQDILTDIIAADNRAGETIRRLRLLFRKGEVENEPMDVNPLVQDVLKILNSDLINNMIATQTELGTTLPLVNGDRVQMQQVLINLIVNASDAMASMDAPDRGLLVRTSCDQQTGVTITVSDRGCGILAGRLEEIFEPFVTTKGYGMGLGLAVCRTIITAHGGKIWATNNADRGASFHISLPAIPAAVPETVAVAAAS